MNSLIILSLGPFFNLKTLKAISLFNLAVSDYIKAPQIKAVNYAAYTGQVGDTISIRAIDDFKVDKVTVSIENSSEVEIENGTAVLSFNRARIVNKKRS